MKASLICKGEGCSRFLIVATPGGVVENWQFGGYCSKCAERWAVAHNTA